MCGVIAYLEKARSRYPNHIAVIDEFRKCTYQQLWESAIAIAEKIGKFQIQNRPIVVISERDSRCVELFWGILYSRNFYVPLNNKTDKNLFISILESAHPFAIFSCEWNEEIAAISDQYGIDYKTYSELTEHASNSVSFVDLHVIDADPAYMVFTSGTTGAPKGVVKSHGCIKAFVESFCKEFTFSDKDVFGNQAEFDYDVAAKDLYLTVYHGAALAIIPKKCFLMPSRLPEFLALHRITTLIWAVAAIRLVARSGCFHQMKSTPDLKRVFFSGENLDTGDLQDWITVFPETSYVNLYAPSEVAGNCMFYQVDNLRLPEQLPLGEAFENVEVLVLKEDDSKIQEGETGEIYVRGSFLASGYYMRQEETNSKFIQNPLHKDYIDYVYRTGDMAKLKNGVLYFAGRRDDQVKFMGHRIELGEIEHVFREMGMGNCCCCFLKDENALLLFYEGELQPAEITKKLLSRLPKYKVPTRYQRVEKLVCNARGKIDKNFMQVQYKRRMAMREKVLSILQNVRPDIDFFMEEKLLTEEVLDSYDILSLLSAMEEEFQVQLNVEDVVEENYDSLDKLTAYMTKVAGEER